MALTVREYVRDGLTYRCVDMVKGFGWFGRVKTEKHLFIYPSNMSVGEFWFKHIDIADLPESDRKEVEKRGFTSKHVFMYDSWDRKLT